MNVRLQFMKSISNVFVCAHMHIFAHNRFCVFARANQPTDRRHRRDLELQSLNKPKHTHMPEQCLERVLQRRHRVTPRARATTISSCCCCRALCRLCVAHFTLRIFCCGYFRGGSAKFTRRPERRRRRGHTDTTSFAHLRGCARKTKTPTASTSLELQKHAQTYTHTHTDTHYSTRPICKSIRNCAGALACAHAASFDANGARNEWICLCVPLCVYVYQVLCECFLHATDRQQQQQQHQLQLRSARLPCAASHVSVSNRIYAMCVCKYVCGL